MKVGQLFSMDAGDLLAPELAAVLVRLRADARPLPTSPVVRAMEHSCTAGLAGPYLLAARLRTKVDARAILEPHLTRAVTRATA